MKNNFKKIAGTTLVAMSLLTLPTIANEYEKLLISPNTIENSYRVMVNNNEIPTNVYNNENYMMLKLRDVADACGFKLLWNPETEIVGIEFGENKFETKPGENTCILNDMRGAFYGKTEIKDGRTYLSPEVFNMLGMISLTDGNSINLISKSSMPENSAVIKAMGEGIITVHDRNLGEVELILSEKTKIYDENGSETLFSNLKVGDLVEVEYSEVMTLSLPPMNNPLKISLLKLDEENALEIEGTIETKGENFVELKNVNGYRALRLNFDENTKFSHISGNRRIYRADDLTKGMKIKASVSNQFTRSIPAQTCAYEIIIFE